MLRVPSNSAECKHFRHLTFQTKKSPPLKFRGEDKYTLSAVPLRLPPEGSHSSCTNMHFPITLGLRTHLLPCGFSCLLRGDYVEMRPPVRTNHRLSVCSILRPCPLLSIWKSVLTYGCYYTRIFLSVKHFLYALLHKFTQNVQFWEHFPLPLVLDILQNIAEIKGCKVILGRLSSANQLHTAVFFQQ